MILNGGSQGGEDGGINMNILFFLGQDYNSLQPHQSQTTDPGTPRSTVRVSITAPNGEKLKSVCKTIQLHHNSFFLLQEI